jgi:hypothetical protein
MRISSIHLRGFKRFTDTHISEIPATARLVVLAGPNGTGKSSLFDGFRTWHGANGGPSAGWDESYGAKAGSPAIGWHEHVTLNFHEDLPGGPEERKKMIYLRSAFRNEADFQVSTFNRLASPIDTLRINRLIDNDASVSENYQRMLMQTIDGIYDSETPDEATKAQIRDRIIGEVRRSMQRVFPDLLLAGVGSMGSESTLFGTFYFDKGDSHDFMYKNLSAGEKASFDLILDTVIKRKYFDNSIWCIDEPETHLNTRVQGVLLETLVDLLPADCQLWIATHSIGFMRKSWEMAQLHPGQVCFIDLQAVDFDHPVSIVPIQPTREFWVRTLDVALGDLATLVAPERLVLCEGRPQTEHNDRRAAFDATCYRRIFAMDFPNTDFVSVGNSSDVKHDRLEIGYAIQALSSGTEFIRLIDRDMRSETEVQLLQQSGIRALTRRNIESYLLDDDVIRKLCEVHGQIDQIEPALQIKADAIVSSVERGHDSDDLKPAVGEIYTGLRRLLSLTSAGSDAMAFCRDTLAPLLQPGMVAYDQLRQDVFED